MGSIRDYVHGEGQPNAVKDFRVSLALSREMFAGATASTIAHNPRNIDSEPKIPTEAVRSSTRAPGIRK